MLDSIFKTKDMAVKERKKTLLSKNLQNMNVDRT